MACPLRSALALTLAPVLYLTACGGGGNLTTPTSSGTLSISTSTAGPEPDADGYTFQIDGGPLTPIASTATTTTDLAAGTHSIRLTGLADNCTVADNPRSATVVGGQTTTATFAVTCTPTTGSLTITAVTTGPSPDANGYQVTVDGAERGALPVNGSLTLAGLPSGTHSVGLSGVAANCQVQGDNPRAAAIPGGETVRFTVTCGSPPMLGWRHMDTGTSYYLQGVWGSSAADLFTVGETADADPTSAMLHFSGQAWTEQLTVPNQRIEGVWGSGPTDVFAVGFNSISAGSGGLLYRYNGTSWTLMEDPPVSDPMYLGVWGSSGSDVYAVGEYFDSQDNSLISHFDGISWTQVVIDNPDFQIATDVYGTSATDVYVVGYYFPQEAYFVLHYDGLAWTGTSFNDGVLGGGVGQRAERCVRGRTRPGRRVHPPLRWPALVPDERAPNGRRPLGRLGIVQLGCLRGRPADDPALRWKQLDPGVPGRRGRGLRPLAHRCLCRGSQRQRASWDATGGSRDSPVSSHRSVTSPGPESSGTA
jgi:hypothetical protein